MALLYGVMRGFYAGIVKRGLFLFEPEAVHVRAVSIGESLGKSRIARRVIGGFLKWDYPELTTSLFGITFKSPIGLAAGFDYEARLPTLLPFLGFGFGTVGTLTHRPYGGNPPPMLGRLPQSRSLMVNKGFKNRGVSATLAPWNAAKFSCPVGVSIGKTNDADIATQAEAVADVVSGFQDAERSGVAFSYYELNISCPNLAGSVEFYDPAHLDELLSAIRGLGLSRPVFVKMPISKTNREIEGLLDIIMQYPFIAAVIFGNLQRDRKNPAFVSEEVERFPTGNFSGAPCQERSDELIRLAYEKYGTRLKIIGCGGIFSAEDAYRKIRAGASLVQLITGLIFEGPQLVAEINSGLVQLFKRDGYRHITEAIGSSEAR